MDQWCPTLCCCCSHTSHHKTFPRKKGAYCSREITDKACCACFVIFLFGMAAVIVHGIWMGNPRRLTHGYDWEGQVCGVDAKVLDKKYLYFCGSPERAGSFPKYLLDGSTTCVASCPVDTSVTVTCLQPAFHNFSSYKGGTIAGVPEVETLEMTITQSIVQQPSYPSELFGGRFCVPQQAKAAALRDQIVNGPWGHTYRPLLMVGGIMDAWPLLLGSAVLSALLSVGIFRMLDGYAGPAIFGSMVLSALLTLAAGVFFAWAIFVDTNDTTTDYARFNPIMSVFLGDEARLYSVGLGMVLCLIAGVLGILAATSMTHIDECIGLIAAACECLNSTNSSLSFLWPLLQGSAFVAMCVAIFFLGLPFVASLAELDEAQIVVNDMELKGYQRVWNKKQYQMWELVFYLIGVWWIIEFYIQWGHYVVAYAVSCWYFTPGNLQPVNNHALLQKANVKGKHVSVRVGGVDANYGQRDGTVMEVGGGGKVLVVPVGKKGPGLGRNDLEVEKFVKDFAARPAPCGGVIAGNTSCLFYHIGSIALGAPIIAVFRPFRLVSQCVSGFLARTSTDPQKGPGFDANPGTANLKGCAALCVACMDQAFGRWSKLGYVEMVLSGGGEGYFDCCQKSYEFLAKAGGSLAYLHGAMLMYETIACIFVTLVCGWTTMIFQDKLDAFSSPTSSYYIENKQASTAASMVIAFCITFAWMSLWNQTADVLLYCVAWNRRQTFLGIEKNETDPLMGPAEGKRGYCPQSLRYLIPDYELSPHYEQGIHAHGLGQMGAIIAAMEHGAMNTNKGAPNYSSAMGSMLATTQKFT